MTVQELEQALLNLSFREKWRVIQILLKNMLGLGKGTTETLSRPSMHLTQSSPVLVLERLAKANAVGNIEDPLSWQQEQREDRPMPGREL